MSWKNYYNPPKESLWQGRSDSGENQSFFQIIRMLDLTNNELPEVKNQTAFICIGFSCDEGIKRNQGRIGAAQGPDQVKSTLARLPVSQHNFLCFDGGNITCHDGQLEHAQQALAHVITLLLNHHFIPIVIGGGHELAWGHFQGIINYHPQPLQIVNFDAHLDMRPLSGGQGTSGSPFLQIAKHCQSRHLPFAYHCLGIQRMSNTESLFATAKAHQVKILYADEFADIDSSTRQAFVNQIVKDPGKIYLSLCLDVFSAAVAPGVSAPQPLGILPWQGLPSLRQLAASGKVLSYDIAELSPPFDVDQRTAKLAASFIYEIIHHHPRITKDLL